LYNYSFYCLAGYVWGKKGHDGLSDCFVHHFFFSAVFLRL